MSYVWATILTLAAFLVLLALVMALFKAAEALVPDDDER